MNAARRNNFVRHETGHPASDIHSRVQRPAEESTEIAKRVTVNIVYSLENNHEVLDADVSISERGCVLTFYRHGLTYRIPLRALNAYNFSKELLLGHDAMTSEEDDLGNKFNASVTIYGTPKQASLRLDKLMKDFLHQS